MATSKPRAQHIQLARAGSPAKGPNALAFPKEKSGEMLRASRDGPRSATERWGGNQILFSDGFLIVPTKFLRRYASLNPPLTAGEALFVLQLMTFKWERAAPFPSYGSIAKAMGVTDKMARR